MTEMKAAAAVCAKSVNGKGRQYPGGETHLCEI